MSKDIVLAKGSIQSHDAYFFAPWQTIVDQLQKSGWIELAQGEQVIQVSITDYGVQFYLERPRSHD